MLIRFFLRAFTCYLFGRFFSFGFRDRKWLEEKQMGCFLGVAQGSAEPPVLVEMRYNGASSGKTVAVVGKGELCSSFVQMML